MSSVAVYVVFMLYYTNSFSDHFVVKCGTAGKSTSKMSGVFIYWDNSNIFIEAQRLAESIEDSPDVRYRVRIHFENLLRLAHADRNMVKAVAAGSVPPELRHLWNRIQNLGVGVELFDRKQASLGEQEVPDAILQREMLRDGFDNNGNPGTIVMLTGDGAGYESGAGFHAELERLHNRGWGVEVLSWSNSCNYRMRQWAEENGVFVPLDDFYYAITFLEPSREGHLLARSRQPSALDLTERPLSKAIP